MAAPSTRRPGARTLTNVGEAQPLIGRVIDRASIASLFNEGARLVTIVGPGGMGKTRLASCFAQEQIEAYSAPGDGGVWFVDLTAARSVAGLCAALASVLGVRLGATKDETTLLAQTGRALDRRGRVLVVLDNFEMLAGHGAPAAVALLRAAPRARLLVTSRVSLDVAAEHRWPIQGLALPPPFESTPIESLLRVESIDLFLRRARQVRPDLAVDDELVRSAAAIASHLEGIPLALELAAARVGVVSAAQLVELLAAGREDVLVRPREDGRHASMRTVVADSFRMLDARERATLIACAVFEGGFDLGAAEAVLGDGRSVIASLETLVAHSLVQLAHDPEHGAPRFSLYEVIREYAASELAHDPGLGVELRARHARWFASHMSPRSELPNLLRAHATVTTELPLCAEQVAQALTLALAIAAVDQNGDLGRRLKILDDTLALARSLRPAASVRSFTEALIARGRAHAELGAFDAATGDFDEAMTLAIASADEDAQASIHIGIGEVVEARGDTAAARERFAAALARTSTPRDAAAIVREAEARAALAHAYRREGRLADADAEIVASIAAQRAAGNEDGLSSAIFEAGVLALFRQSYPSAIARFDEALELARRLGARQREAAIMTARGTMEQELGNLDRARDLHEAAVVIFRDAGNLYAEASTLYYLGGAHLESGHSDDAEAVLAAALALVRSIGVPRYEALILGARAAQHAILGHVHEAAALLEAARSAARKCATEPTLEAALAIHGLQLGLRAASPAERDETFAIAEALAASRPCDDPRFALRVLAHAREAAGRDGSAVDPALASALVVRAEGKAFLLPSASEEIDLRRRAPLARILHALAQRRVESPGEALRVEDILATGWPGERVRYDAGANRVYVALAELRKLGLRDWIMSDASGYRLATSRRVVLDP